MTVEWEWQWVVNADAYSFGDNPVIDWIRVLCVIVGLALMFAMMRVLREAAQREIPMPAAQQLRFVALGAANLYISITEVAVVGTPGTPRLLVGIVALTAGVLGVSDARELQRQQPMKGHSV